MNTRKLALMIGPALGLAAVVVALALLAARPAAAVAQASPTPRDVITQTVTLAPAQDNTLYETELGNISNGMGEYLFAGTTGNGAIRRALLGFDLAAIPSNATVLTATLSLTMSRSIAGETAVTLHSVSQAWGEGASDAIGEEGAGAAAEPGDATWLNTFFDTATWTTPGGDFAATPLATAPVEDAARYDWTSAEFAADVEAKIANPTANFGWVLLGDEANTTTAKRFDSAQNATVENRPSLTITFVAEEPQQFTAFAPAILRP